MQETFEFLYSVITGIILLQIIHWKNVEKPIFPNTDYSVCIAFDRASAIWFTCPSRIQIL